MDKQKFIDQIIFHDGERWLVLGAGAQRDGNTFCHLESTSRGRQQKNGWVPVQICDWVSTEVLEAAVKRDTEVLEAAVKRDTGAWIKGTEDDDEDYEYIPSAAELS